MNISFTKSKSRFTTFSPLSAPSSALSSSSSVSQSSWQNLLDKVQSFISVVEMNLAQKAENEYDPLISNIKVCSEMFTQVNQLMKTDKDFIDLNAPDNQNLVQAIELNKWEVIGLYENGQWILPQNLPTNEYPTDDTHWVDMEQLDALKTVVENQISLASDTTPVDVLQKQALFQQLTQQYTFMVQLISQRNELLKSIIQAIR